MKRKVVSMMLVCATMTAMLAGCGNSEKEPTANNTDSKTEETKDKAEETKKSDDKTKSSGDEEVTLTVLAGQSTTDAGIEDMIDEALEEKYPNITLEWECVDWGNDFQPKMQQYLQSGLPDIMIGKAQEIGRAHV